MKLEAIVVAICAVLMGANSWMVKKLLESFIDRLKEDIKELQKNMRELKENTEDFKEFSTRAEIILEYHEKRLDECDEFIEKTRPRHYEF